MPSFARGAAVLAGVLFAFPPPCRAAAPGASTSTEPPTPPATVPAAVAPAVCAGAYADDFATLGADARKFDRAPGSAFSYCTRNQAVYECLSYGADGAVRRDRKHALMHGTAFAYRRQGDDTLLLTNDHVASWPAVTDGQHAVDGVPPGCKRVSESISLVDDEHDSYGRDDVPVTRVVTAPELDVAVLRAHAPLQVMPWKVGHSGALRERDVVEVRGFPLGAFRATSIGKVITAHDHDDEGDWNHDDFVVDALLSAGNSGSPVLAISCATGEYELVGIYHAGYVGGSALNVVVGIDQVRYLMTTLKRSGPPADGAGLALDRASREQLDEALGATRELFFPFGGHAAMVRAGADGALVFAVWGRDFPSDDTPLVVVEDLPPPDEASFGALGRLWFGSPRGLKARDAAALDAGAREDVEALAKALRGDALARATYRATAAAEGASRQSSEKARRAARALARLAAGRADLAQIAEDLAERLGPAAGERGSTIAEALAPTPAAVGAARLP
jgi:serine protease Do